MLRNRDYNVIIEFKNHVEITRNIAVFLLSLAFQSFWGNSNTPWWMPYVICLPVYILFSVCFFKDLSYEVRYPVRIIFTETMLPYFIAFVYSLILYVCGAGIVNSVPRSIMVVIKESAAVFLAVLLLYRFRDCMMEILADAMILSYVYSILNAVVNIGFKGFLQYLSTVALYETSLNRWFERHDLGISIGIVLLYGIISGKKIGWLRYLLCLLVFLLCWKRIAFAALIFAVSIWFVIKKISLKQRVFCMRMIMTGLLVFCFLFVLLISQNAIYSIASKIGFDFSNRRYLYTFAVNLYDWSLLYMGHGMGAVGKYMKTLQQTGMAVGIGKMEAVHSDILKTYIELGFVGSFMWFFWYLFHFKKTLTCRFGNIAAYLYCIVTIYAYIIYFTDNTMEYFIFQTTLYSFILSVCYKELKENVMVTSQ